MIEILISLLIFLIIASLVWWIASLLPIPQPFKNIVLAIVLLITLLLFLAKTNLIHL